MKKKMVLLEDTSLHERFWSKLVLSLKNVTDGRAMKQKENAAARVTFLQKIYSLRPELFQLPVIN